MNGYDPTGGQDVLEYGLLAKQSASNGLIAGYLDARIGESLMGCARDYAFAVEVRAFMKEFIQKGTGWSGQIWREENKGDITVAFSDVIQLQIDDFIREDSVLVPQVARGDKDAIKRLEFKAEEFELGNEYAKYLYAAASGSYLSDKIIELVAPFAVGKFVFAMDRDPEKLTDRCSNHAERKILRKANPPANLMLNVGASNGICIRCQLELSVKEVGCWLPIGGNEHCGDAAGQKLPPPGSWNLF